MATREEELKILLEPVVTALGCELWGIEFHSQGRHGILRVFIDRPEEGVSIDDCEQVSRQISSVMDVEDPISIAYTLEVSSPGLDRALYTLEHYQRFIGHQIKLRLRVAFDGRRNFAGVLTGIQDDEIVLHMGENQYVFPFEVIERANVVPQFD